MPFLDAHVNGLSQIVHAQSQARIKREDAERVDEQVKVKARVYAEEDKEIQTENARIKAEQDAADEAAYAEGMV
jgi:hypothetical protein